MISFVVPAHNEEAYLPRTLEAIHASARAAGRPYEVIVVDDASTDRTAEVARRHNARVVRVNHRQIAATRNSGARAARGEQIIFVDADTTVNARAVASAARAMDKGAAGGGAPTQLGMHEIVPLYIRLIAFLGVVGSKLFGFTGGAFMFCTREAFDATGGFNERLYWSEEGGFALALKREGRFVVLWRPVMTSGRRFRVNSGLQMLSLVGRAAVFPRKMMTRRSSVEKVWYDSNRANDDSMPDSWAVRASNGIALVVILVVVTGPVWNFVPRSLTPRGSALGDVRLIIGVFLCHVGLFFWPLALVLLVNVLRQKRWTGLAQSAALIALCLWQGWGAAEGMIWFWPWVYRGVATFLRG